MAKKSSFKYVKKWSNKDIQKSINKFLSQNIETQISVFNYIGQEFINKARDSGNYKNHTGNLRSSIGYAVISNGKIENSVIESSGKDIDGSGVAASKRLIQQVMSKNGIELIVTAGMDYAKAVESKGYNVLTLFAPSKSQLAKDFSVFLSRL